MYSPSYLELHRSGELRERAARLRELASPCRLCPHQCEVSRAEGDSTGICGSPFEAMVNSAFPHFGEEEPLVGRRGSGTIFFSGCNLRCSFCQNWEISHNSAAGTVVNDRELAALMLDLQRQGCHNINLVTPTHFAHALVAALDIAAAQGLGLPLVYNCGGYESVETLKLLDGVVDIYMPDAKFFDNGVAAKLMAPADYASRAREALAEMHRQVGELAISPLGTAYRGLLIRHLVMPGGIAGTAEWAGWIAGHLSKDSYVNVMGQYHPCNRATYDPLIGRAPSGTELDVARRQALDAGLSGRGFVSGN